LRRYDPKAANQRPVLLFKKQDLARVNHRISLVAGLRKILILNPITQLLLPRQPASGEHRYCGKAKYMGLRIKTAAATIYLTARILCDCLVGINFQ
jgi:hypothetical protein